jgi:hypothetical protein
LLGAVTRQAKRPQLLGLDPHRNALSLVFRHRLLTVLGPLELPELSIGALRFRIV